MSGGGSLADHLGAAALALDSGCRHPELVLGAGPQLGHPETGPAPRHLVAGVTLLPAVLNLPAVTTNQRAYMKLSTNQRACMNLWTSHSRPSFLCVPVE